MNVLVEMEIPKSCEECPFAYETEGVSHDFCQYVGYESDIQEFVGARSNERPRWCHPYELEMTACDSLMKLYDMNYMNASTLIDAYEKVLKEDDAEREKEDSE